MSQILMNITYATILKKNIDNNFWLKILLAKTYIQNNKLIKAFSNNITLQKT